MEEGSFPVWKGLFDWSMKFQDGTRPTALTPEEFTPERRAWLDSALKDYMKDFAHRMKEIRDALDAAQSQEQGEAGAAGTAAMAAAASGPEPTGGVTAGAKKEAGASGAADGAGGAAGAEVVKGENEGEEAAAKLLGEQEALLDELMDIVCSLDHARDLHKIGGLPPLLRLLSCRHPSLRWRAAEVLATCAASNPPVQQWFLDGGVLPPLMTLLGDSDGTCRTKALLALSALVRHSAPGLAAFRAAGGLPKLVDLCSDRDAKVQRKAMALLQYVISRDRATAGSEACSLGVVPRLCRVLGAVGGTAGSSTATANGGSADGDAGGPAGGAAAASANGTNVAPQALEQCEGKEEEGEDASSSDLRQAALSLLLEFARGRNTWAAVKEVTSLEPALARLRSRHAALPVEDREAEQEEDELASELQGLLVSGPPPPPEGGRVEGGKDGDSDHVPIETAGRGAELPLKRQQQNAVAVQQGHSQGAGEGSAGQEQGFTLAPGAGSLMVTPKVDLF